MFTRIVPSVPTNTLASTQLSFSAYQQDNGTSWHDFGQQSIEWHSTHSKLVLPAISPKLPTKTKDMCSLPRYTTTNKKNPLGSAISTVFTQIKNDVQIDSK